jgi:hypothetical protein
MDLDGITASEPPRARNRRRWWWVVGIVAVAVVGVGAFGFWAFRSSNKTPSFPALADAPDQSLHGTVAYLDWKVDACLKVVPMSGTPTKTITCLKGVNGGAVSDMTWLADGRVQLTQYGQWRKIINIGSGAVEEIPAAQVPKTGPATKPVTVSPDGRELATTGKGGHVQLTLEDSTGRRVLLDANGGSLYALGTPNWSPDYTLVLTTDGAARLLVTTLETPPTTSILATELGGAWAATSRDISKT